MRRRARIDAMTPKDVTTWLLIEDQYGKPLRIEELAPGTDPRMVMIREQAKSLRLGFEIEELPGTLPIYFCTKDGHRHKVMIVERDPNEQAGGRYGFPSPAGLIKY